MKISRKRNQFFILVIDILILAISLFLTLWVRNLDIPSVSTYLSHLKFFSGIMVIWVLTMYTLMMYSLDVPFTSAKISLRLLLVNTFCGFLGFTFFYLFPKSSILPKTVLILYSIISYLLILAWRWLYTYIFVVVKEKKKVLFMGYTSTVPAVLEQLEHFSYVGFRAVAIFDEHIDSILDQSIPYTVKKLSTTIELMDFIVDNNIKIFILPEEKALSKDARHILFNMVEKKAVFYTLPDFYELIARKIPLGDINEMWFLRNITFEGQLPFQLLKRVFDIVFSLILLLISLPFWPLIALIIKIESPGPVFFKQTREGKNGSSFQMIKFRTMRSDKNDFKPTSEKDTRITHFGNFMRKTRIDEIPQMLNILKNNMSLIGPRPERPEIAVELEKSIPYYRQRLIVKPGITGWDQVSGEYHSPSIEDTYKKLQYDLYYIKNQSLFLDISILFKTVMTVFMKAGR